MKDLLITKWRTLSVEGGKDDVEGGTGRTLSVEGGKDDVEGGSVCVLVVSLYTWLCLSS